MLQWSKILFEPFDNQQRQLQFRSKWSQMYYSNVSAKLELLNRNLRIKIER